MEAPTVLDPCPPAPAARLVGELDPERFSLGPLLGRGSQALVRSAYDHALGRPVALKLLTNTRRRSNATARLRREAQLLAGLSHPHVVRLLGAGRWRETPTLILEALPGQTASSLLERRGLLPWREAAGLLGQVFAGVAHVHARGVIHRDLKLSNVLVSGDQAWLIDFGLSRRWREPSTLTQVGFVVGTPSYTAPERACGQAATPATDVFALGVLAYRFLGGCAPFQGESRDALLRALLRDEPPRLRALPEPLWRVLARCLQKDVRTRYPSAGPLAAAWRRALAATAEAQALGTGASRKAREAATLAR